MPEPAGSVSFKPLSKCLNTVTCIEQSSSLFVRAYRCALSYECSRRIKEKFGERRITVSNTSLSFVAVEVDVADS